MAKGEWKPRRLDELGFLGRGKSRHRPRNDASLYGGPYPFIQTADVMAADPYITSYSQTYSELGFQQSKMWPSETLCMTIAGANTARTAILKFEACFPDSIVGFIPDKSKADIVFVKYALDLLRDRFLSVSRGATQDNLGLDKILSFPILAPDVDGQRRIGAILSAYDELMENSQRRIRLLEAMARALYREWFVHFRIPAEVLTKAGASPIIKLLASPLGDIPQGWEVKPLFELTKVNYGKNLPTKKLADDGAYPVYGAAKIIGRYTEYTRERQTIICGCRGSVGEMQITQPQCFVTNNSFTFDPTHPGNFFWLYHSLKERGLRDVIGGAAQPQITLEGISSVELVTPPLLLRTHYQQTVSAMFEQAWALDTQIQNLRRTCDLLLPRLLSGQVNP
jgi:type I restriction enzyme, S subunit